MSDIVFRTPGPWGGGLGADLTANQVDTNFWVLYSLILALQDAAPDTIAYFTVTGDQMWITMTDHYVFGPFTIPTATFNFRGEWQPNNAYAVNDIFTADGAVYLVIYPQTSSGATFYDLANDGQGHNYYGLLLAAAPNPLPTNGLPGQVLQWVTGLESPAGVEWAYIARNIALYLESAPNPNEVVAQYCFTESTQFPENLVGSSANVGIWGTGTQEYQLYQNDANIGTITFSESPSDSVDFVFPNTITFEPNDVLTIIGPSVPDPHMAQIAFTLKGAVILP